MIPNLVKFLNIFIEYFAIPSELDYTITCKSSYCSHYFLQNQIHFVFMDVSIDVPKGVLGGSDPPLPPET